MDTKFQTSFIPQKPVVPSSKIPHARKPTGFFSLIATLVFLASFLATGGVFFYKGYLSGRITSLSNQLDRMRASFEPELIDELSRLDTRLKTSSTLLSEHLSTSSFFEWLESITLQNVQFTNFKYESTQGGLIVEMRGQARNYVTLVRQSDILAESTYVRRSVFSNLDLDSNGNVLFSLAITFDPAGILYKDSLQSLSFEGFPF